MAHYAFLDENNIVTSVIVGKDEDTDGIDWEQKYSVIQNQTCKRTSYNTQKGVHNNGGTAFRGNYGGIGYVYDTDNDVFYPQQPYPSWTLSSDWVWEAPTTRPNDENGYEWNEDTQSWKIIVLE